MRQNHGPILFPFNQGATPFQTNGENKNKTMFMKKIMLQRPYRVSISECKSLSAVFYLIVSLHLAVSSGNTATCEEECDRIQSDSHEKNARERSVAYTIADTTYNYALLVCRSDFQGLNGEGGEKAKCALQQLQAAARCETDFGTLPCVIAHDTAAGNAMAEKETEALQCAEDGLIDDLFQLCICKATAKMDNRIAIAAAEKARCIGEKNNGKTKCTAEAAATATECVSAAGVAKAKCEEQASLAWSLSILSADQAKANKDDKAYDAWLVCYLSCGGVTCQERCLLNYISISISCREPRDKSLGDALMTRTTKLANNGMEYNEKVGKAATANAKALANARNQKTYDEQNCLITYQVSIDNALAAYALKIACGQCPANSFCRAIAAADQAEAQLRADNTLWGTAGDGGCLASANNREAVAVSTANSDLQTKLALANLDLISKNSAANIEEQARTQIAWIVFNYCMESVESTYQACLALCAGGG